MFFILILLHVILPIFCLQVFAVPIVAVFYGFQTPSSFAGAAIVAMIMFVLHLGGVE
ncbi:hypothetical protein P4U24_01090 [Aeribacillus composti]|uniref:hypothetical protein n=1 Tax=Aeribacillus composti TaxID=1868734 RepID=UPI002E219535|nr:hypothetical protein [Aeribacillus composti]